MIADFRERTSLARQGCHRNVRGSRGDGCCPRCAPPRPFLLPQQISPPPAIITELIHVCICWPAGRNAHRHSWHIHVLLLNTHWSLNTSLSCPVPSHPDVIVICQQTKVPVYPVPQPGRSRSSDARWGRGVEVAATWLCVRFESAVFYATVFSSPRRTGKVAALSRVQSFNRLFFFFHYVLTINLCIL